VDRRIERPAVAPAVALEVRRLLEAGHRPDAEPRDRHHRLGDREQVGEELLAVEGDPADAVPSAVAASHKFWMARHAE
jgi:hypothetical protein